MQKYIYKHRLYLYKNIYINIDYICIKKLIYKMYYNVDNL